MLILFQTHTAHTHMHACLPKCGHRPLRASNCLKAPPPNLPIAASQPGNSAALLPRTTSFENNDWFNQPLCVCLCEILVVAPKDAPNGVLAGSGKPSCQSCTAAPHASQHSPQLPAAGLPREAPPGPRSGVLPVLRHRVAGLRALRSPGVLFT